MCRTNSASLLLLLLPAALFLFLVDADECPFFPRRFRAALGEGDACDVVCGRRWNMVLAWSVGFGLCGWAAIDCLRRAFFMIV